MIGRTSHNLFVGSLVNIMSFINLSCLGDHAWFEDRVGEKPNVLYLHNKKMISASGAENIGLLVANECTIY